MALSAGDRLGSYEILAPLGAGGMGEVYRAKHVKLQRDVALKVLPNEFASDEERLRRFEREARTASSLNHPNIVTIYDIDEQDGTHFMAMELVGGRTLRARLDEGPFPSEEMLDLATQISAGLARAHSASIVHRDLKPENVMVTDEGQVKILDFGLAKPTPTRRDGLSELTTMEQATQAGMILGTVPYMSPEQAAGREVDHRSDQFSFGSILYEMVTGRRPFQKDTTPQTLAAIIESEPEPLTGKAAAPLVAIVERCLFKAPEKRFVTSDELVEALRGIPAATLDPPERRPSRRGVLVLAAAVLATILAALVLTSGGRLWNALMPKAKAPVVGSVAVLPLKNLSGDLDQEYFVDGMTEALITNLAKLGGLTVIARSSVMRYRGTDRPVAEIARELGVDAIVEGSAVRAGDRVRIMAQLIEPESGQALWAESYDRAMRDVLGLQGEVARAVAREIGVAVAPSEADGSVGGREVDPETYEAYLRGMYFLRQSTPEAMQKGIAQLHKAVEKDPADPFAYAGLALGYAILGHAPGSTPEAFGRARAAALRALELDDSLAEAHLALGDVSLYYEWNWPATEASLGRAIELNPSLAPAHVQYAWYLDLMGQLDQAEMEFKRAQELDPLTPLFTAWLGAWYLLRQDRPEEAAAEARRALELDPDFPVGLLLQGRLLTREGRYEEAIAAHRKMATAAPGLKANLALTYARAGRRDEALEILSEWRASHRPGQALDIARMAAALGETDEAFRWLEEAYENRNGGLPWFQYFPALRALADDPRSKDLVRRLDLPQ